MRLWEMVEVSHKPNAYLWGKIASTVRDFTIGRTHRGEFLNITEIDMGDLAICGFEKAIMVEHSSGPQKPLMNGGLLSR